jgi:hypothetical protein
MSDEQPKPEPQPRGPTGPPRRPPQVVMAAADAEGDDGDYGSKHHEIRKAPATPDEVTCPSCATSFPITPEVYGAIAECSECRCEFQIVGPQGAAEIDREQEPAPGPSDQVT